VSGILSLAELAERLHQLQLDLALRGQASSFAYRRALALAALFTRRDGGRCVTWQEVAEARDLLHEHDQI